jgi:nucleoside-diphosphate-sugar epimerase
MATLKFIPNRKISKSWSFGCEFFSLCSFSWGHVNPIGPRACYDEGKRVAETLTYGFHNQDGVDVRVARIFNTYGSSCIILPVLSLN